MRAANATDLARVLAALDALGIAHRLVGDAPRIVRVGSLMHREPHALYYYTGDDPAVFDGLRSSVLLCNAVAAAPQGDNAALVVEGDVQQAFYRLCAELFTDRPPAGVHPTAIVHPDAVIGEGVSIGAYCVVERCTIGAGTVLLPHAVVLEGCAIGDRVRVEPHVCIGATGVVWTWGEDGKRVVLPQLGGVRVGDDVFLGAGVAIVRGMLNEWTMIGEGSMIAPGSRIGHSVVLGKYVHLANNVSIAGSARIGDRCFLGSGCSVRSHAKLAPDTIVGAGAAVVSDVTEPGITVAGVPAVALPPKDVRKGVPRPPAG